MIIFKPVNNKNYKSINQLSMKIKRFKKDIKKRKLHKKFELYQKTFCFLLLYVKSILLKSIIQKRKYCKIYSKFFKSKIKNYCIISGRSKGVYKKLKISRIVFRSLGNTGYFFGLKKAM